MSRNTAPRHGIAVPRQFEGSYAATLAVAILALAPFIIVSTASLMFAPQVDAALHAAPFATQMISGFAIAGYAFGALLGGDLIQRFFQRRLFLICQALFVAGCIVTATSHSILAYGIGSVLEGFSTGLLLVIALPPVFQRFPPERVPVTVIWVNLGFFGAVCAGPFIGGAMAAVHGWRWFHGALGILGAANLVVAALTLSFYDPPNPEIRLDIAALLLGLGAVFLPFWATGELAVASFDAPIFIAPLTAGLVCFVALVLTEYHRKEALSPVARMWNTISLVGVLIAMFGGSVFVALVELLERLQIKVAHRSPFETGLLFTPLIGGVCVTAILLGLVVRTRYLPLLILGGMVCLACGAGVALSLGPGAPAGDTIAVTTLLGLAAGATVAPGLYLAGFPVPSQLLGRVFALVELVRSLADYIIAPVLAKVAETGSLRPPLNWAGAHEAIMAALWIANGTTVFVLVLWIGGGVGLPRPDIAGWIDTDRPALESPPLFDLARRRVRSRR